MRFATVEYQGKTFVGAVDKAGEKVTPVSVGDINDLFRGSRGEPIRYPTGVSEQLDYEAELAVIIGKGGRGISKADALKHVWGYTIVNDVTARDLQGRHKQWFLGKSMDTFAPMGPWAVTADEVDLASAGIRCWVNGELRQDGSTAEMFHSIPEQLAWLTAALTLAPGDVLSTGTPPGVSSVQPGDVLRGEIEGLGVIENKVVLGD